MKLYVYHREMTPGALMNAELAEAMSKSRKIIILMSNSYIKSGECKFEAGKAGKILKSQGAHLFRTNSKIEQHQY